jgi:hypothetical protein
MVRRPSWKEIGMVAVIGYWMILNHIDNLSAAERDTDCRIVPGVDELTLTSFPDSPGTDTRPRAPSANAEATQDRLRYNAATAP